MMAMERLLTAKEVSEAWQVHISTVYKWVNMGFIPYVKMGKAVRFIKAQIEEWMRQRTRQGRRTKKLDVIL